MCQGAGISETVTYSHCSICSAPYPLWLSKPLVKTFQHLRSSTFFFFFFFSPIPFSYPFELCTLSSHLITSYIVQSESGVGVGGCSLLVPADAKQRDEEERERKKGKVGGSGRRVASGGTVRVSLRLTAVCAREKKSTFRQEFNRRLAQYGCNQNSHARCQGH